MVLVAALGILDLKLQHAGFFFFFSLEAFEPLVVACEN